MAKLNVIDLSGASVGEVDADDAVFAADVKEHLLWEAVRHQRAKARSGTASAKTRAEVSVTKAKIYKQKGTGNARHGSRRSVIFRGGGVVHGPKPRAYNVGVNKKAMAGALRSALSMRAKQGDLLVIKDFTGDKPKTKQLAEALGKAADGKALIVDSAENVWLKLSARNLADSAYIADGGINVQDILRYPKLLISEASLRKLEQRLKPGKTVQEGAA